MHIRVAHMLLARIMLDTEIKQDVEDPIEVHYQQFYLSSNSKTMNTLPWC